MWKIVVAIVFLILLVSFILYWAIKIPQLGIALLILGGAFACVFGVFWAVEKAS